MNRKILLLTIMLAPACYCFSQGCVAIRNVAGISPDILFKSIGPDDKTVLNISNRYFSASKSYRGDKLFSDTLVENRIYTMNISVLRLLNNGWSVALTLPISANSRTNGADHKGVFSYPKYTTHAFGIGDIRIAVYKWILNPSTSKKGNIQAGLGIKLPTGNYGYEDYFVRNDSTRILAPVDQSIQLGDGGTGITAELSAFYTFGKGFNLYMQGYYLINPRDQNGVSNLKGRQPSPTQIKNSTTVMSVPDQFTLRGGANFELNQFDINAGIRYESVPENDLLGGNKGFRRAATITSVEPGITYKMKRVLIYGLVGIPIRRNIVQNSQNDMTPAGFADIVYTLGVQCIL